mmetsp:Transcript_1894/g.8399  ORF Transcript_1894/g.8399 Transcript_1894/m.8399 type:complete len:329 (-) Transcript_1894:187-1173(-)|eukprot:scaffold1499_cov255-Pinguiococcus_pyrenoidosus.AAC.42
MASALIEIPHLADNLELEKEVNDVTEIDFRLPLAWLCVHVDRLDHLVLDDRLEGDVAREAFEELVGAVKSLITGMASKDASTANTLETFGHIISVLAKLAVLSRTVEGGVEDGADASGPLFSRSRTYVWHVEVLLRKFLASRIKEPATRRGSVILSYLPKAPKVPRFRRKKRPDTKLLMIQWAREDLQTLEANGTVDTDALPQMLRDLKDHLEEDVCGIPHPRDEKAHADTLRMRNTIVEETGQLIGSFPSAELVEDSSADDVAQTILRFGSLLHSISYLAKGAEAYRALWTATDLLRAFLSMHFGDAPPDDEGDVIEVEPAFGDRCA